MIFLTVLINNIQNTNVPEISYMLCKSMLGRRLQALLRERRLLPKS